MKKSEMIEHISAVMHEAYVARQHSSEAEDAYWNRHAAQLLDMMLGFGMIPPTWYYRGEPPLTLEMPLKSNTWEPE